MHTNIPLLDRKVLNGPSRLPPSELLPTEEAGQEREELCRGDGVEKRKRREEENIVW